MENLNDKSSIQYSSNPLLLFSGVVDKFDVFCVFVGNCLNNVVFALWGYV
jgi:hypothetical protein